MKLSKQRAGVVASSVILMAAFPVGSPGSGSWLLASSILSPISSTTSSSSEWGATHTSSGVELNGTTTSVIKVPSHGTGGGGGTGGNNSGEGRGSGAKGEIASSTSDSAEQTYSWRHLCADNSSGNISIACAVAAPDVCPPGEYYGAILSIDAAGVASETGSYGCTGGATAAAGPAGGNEGATVTTAPPVVIVVTAADFQRLVIPPSTIKLDTGGNTLRTAHTNIYANAGVKMLNTTVLGQPVRVRAIPIEYIWDYGD